MHDYRLPRDVDLLTGRAKPARHVSTTPGSRRAMRRQSSNFSLASSVDSDRHANTAVYVKDAAYVWLPAHIQSAAEERVMVKIVLPDDWADTTILKEKSSITELEYQMTSGGFGSYSSPKFGRLQNDESASRKEYSYERGQSELDEFMAKGVTRTLSLRDYPNSELPLQNTDRHAQRLLPTNTPVQRNTIYHPLVNGE